MKSHVMKNIRILDQQWKNILLSGTRKTVCFMTISNTFNYCFHVVFHFHIYLFLCTVFSWKVMYILQCIYIIHLNDKIVKNLKTINQSWKSLDKNSTVELSTSHPPKKIWGTISVISSDPPLQDCNARFTTVPLKP